ncbi:hypothetical protein PHISP_08088 [Aspergillus sp. HF37]|nr:hypothetical protein PHISP_08088 [Aspergillus sp. HF37]
MSHRAKPKGRDVTVSKALSYLLRHAAEREGLKMNAQGYANVSDVLSWRKLKSQKVTLAEILNAVAESDKKRFALFHVPSEESESTTATHPPVPPAAPTTPVPEDASASITPPATSAAQETATQKALAARGDTDPSHFLIRATQGHSIKSIEASSYLERLSLTDETSLPRTVVHGTFHSAWPRILESGGLKCMGRNHVHFATGPALEEAVPSDDGKVLAQGNGGGKVISGMRRDAQVLIYIDLRRALAAGCPFWRSENGVILSEGLDGGSMVPAEFFDVVVERKKKLGRIWEGGKVMREL